MKKDIGKLHILRKRLTDTSKAFSIEEFFNLLKEFEIKVKHFCSVMGINYSFLSNLQSEQKERLFVYNCNLYRIFTRKDRPSISFNMMQNNLFGDPNSFYKLIDIEKEFNIDYFLHTLFITEKRTINNLKKKKKDVIYHQDKLYFSIKKFDFNSIEKLYKMYVFRSNDVLVGSDLYIYKNKYNSGNKLRYNWGTKGFYNFHEYMQKLIEKSIINGSDNLNTISPLIQVPACVLYKKEKEIFFLDDKIYFKKPIIALQDENE